jgi:broad specificity polyphosphatase/5'/3'-nucleotidase SurE
MSAQNCWEIKNCGREPGGAKIAELGICPAATDLRANGINSGKNAGRACWAVTGTLCGGQVQGSFASKLSNCMACEFYRIVQKEEGSSYLSSKEIINRLK